MKGYIYIVKFESDGVPIEKEVKSLGKEMNLHDIRLELYNDHKDIRKLKVVDSKLIKGQRY